MAFDFKKEYRDLYLPKTKPMLIDVPAMTFAAVAGTGNPNEDSGAYQQALGLLYGFSYSVKMAKMQELLTVPVSPTKTHYHGSRSLGSPIL